MAAQGTRKVAAYFMRGVAVTSAASVAAIMTKMDLARDHPGENDANAELHHQGLQFKETAAAKCRSLWRSSLDKLAEVEARLFASAGVQTRSSFVPISFQNSQIYTVTLDPTEAPTTPSTSTAPLGQLTGTLASTDSTAEHPVVLVHGFGAGSAIWCANMAAITTRHIVHAIDLLGFGRSSRPKFSAKPEEAEQQMVDAIEEWRKQMGIQKMYLVGHSFGGYLSTSYALKYPERIEHLVLVDPWGYAEAEERQLSRRLTLIVGIISLFNPLTTLRVSGPFGPKLVKKARPDLGVRYPSENPDDIYEYIYRCNSQSPTGETAFKSMMAKLGWAKNPMLHRLMISKSLRVEHRT
ncbi:hypothetical protein WR25_26352 isoform F [Diploscapter pachys]|uniref:AB hydrolase-1 domain-containing protein n=1 Tax=Diploscapter pachys TaxID=2018661 RepID=A0A2A2JJA7_9BILA|nr:hypothetical protein WR25_26352 isoform B [Diploscapter pachys]PAV61826.1 hypothetical protein WR25_26352 isoform F [Diploscapter pachys]